MAATKKAPIDIDDLATKELREISAADFLAALEAGGLSARDLIVWPEKKKVELWVEPENFGRVRVGPIIDIIRGEKKKVELEPGPWFRVAGDPSPQPSFPGAALERLARTIEARLRARPPMEPVIPHPIGTPRKSKQLAYPGKK